MVTITQISNREECQHEIATRRGESDKGESVAAKRRAKRLGPEANGEPITLAAISLLLGLVSAALFSLSLFGIFPLPRLALPDFRSTDLPTPLLARSPALRAVASGRLARPTATGSRGSWTERATSRAILRMLTFTLVRR